MEPIQIHEYLSVNIYEVTLRVYDDDGAYSEKHITIDLHVFNEMGTKRHVKTANADADYVSYGDESELYMEYVSDPSGGKSPCGATILRRRELI